MLYSALGLSSAASVMLDFAAERTIPGSSSVILTKTGDTKPIDRCLMADDGISRQWTFGLQVGCAEWQVIRISFSAAPPRKRLTTRPSISKHLPYWYRTIKEMLAILTGESSANPSDVPISKIRKTKIVPYTVMTQTVLMDDYFYI
ncbi:hypothetical protein I7I51_01801 [Histoplasma capsulatum]|uniref:Uncharacterized protein n=1 Tax=Ajellomyces capsulatus TaxID=5037 RepID=A0A8A1MHY5_AJECA|nr:hypothetical protein I7I51_01801 [Histoplasma capsulatum]